MNKIELLAPAGSIDSLYAAVQMGADAVYLGGNKFSARAYASNFDEATMITAVNYCHLYDVKVYITLNTLLKENEMKEAIEYVDFLYKIGVDALIIQDTGLAYLIRKEYPDFEMHASTQMTIHNGEGARFLKEVGYSRIVLSRELSLQEISYISKDLSIETEIFIHGALCICYSGQCLMSSLIGGRSGNRGRCAQPCRLPYTLIDKQNQRESSAYILSPKDMCTLNNIHSIINTGTTSLKIEGRMKRPEYVAGVVDVYRKVIDSIYSGEEYNYNEANLKLAKLFNREGFSKAYLLGNTGKAMMAYSFPKNTGIKIGKIEKDLTVVLEEEISLQDGIRVGEDGFTISKIIHKGNEVTEAFSGDKVKLLPTKYKQDDILYKTSDIKLLKELEEVYKNPYDRKIDLFLTVKFEVEEPIRIQTVYDNKLFFVEGDIIQKAIKKPLDRDKLVENLSKSGDTPFKFSIISFDGFEEGFLPVSSINSIRRKLIDSIEVYIKEKHDNSKKSKVLSEGNINETVDQKNKPEIPKFIIGVSTLEQLKAIEAYEISDIMINIFNRRDIIDVSKIEGKNIYLKIPNIVKSEFEHVCKLIEERIPYIKGIVTANAGIINKFKNVLKIIGDYKINVFNSNALKFYSNYIEGAAISIELNKKELTEFMKASSNSVQMFLYGKPELMVSEYCPIGSVFGGKDENTNCHHECEKGNFILKDRKDEEFSVLTDKFCRSYIYNGVPINLIPNLEELEKIGFKYFRIDFIDETYDEAINVLKSIKAGKWLGAYNNYTRGHFKRGVE